MSLRKFGKTDVLLNTMKTHPNCEFLIYDGVVYYNSIPALSGVFTSSVLNVDPGYISLYEYNVDKKGGNQNPFIFPFIEKDSSRSSFKTLSNTAAENEWSSSSYGERLYSSYPLSASITREYMATPSGAATLHLNTDDGKYSQIPNYNRHFNALKNRLNYYGQRSLHYVVSSSLSQSGGHLGWNKSEQVINLISIPSIFYGSQIKPGSVTLKMYVTGTVAGVLQDTKQNGELIQVSGSPGSQMLGSGNVAGVVLYEEGFILLTGSWMLNNHLNYGYDGSDPDKLRWLYFAQGAADSVTQNQLAALENMSSHISFKGTSDTQVVTMFAHAKRGQVNHSNNPTFLVYGQEHLEYTSSQVYEENSQRMIKNTVSSSYSEYSASFKRQVYVSRVGIYDKNRNLIGVATLSNPILKEEDRDYAFKLKLDI